MTPFHERHPYTWDTSGAPVELLTLRTYYTADINRRAAEAFYEGEDDETGVATSVTGESVTAGNTPS